MRREGGGSVTTQQRWREWRDRWAGVLLLLVGYGLSKTLTLDSYVTAFGTVRFPMGYVSDVPFMLGASVGVLIAGIAMLLWCGRRRHRFDLPYRVPIVMLVASYGVSLLPVAPGPWLLAALGVVWGCATRLVSVSFIELFVYERSAVAVILQLSCALVFSAALSLALRTAPEVVRFVAWPLMAAACWLCVRWGRGSLCRRIASGEVLAGPLVATGAEAPAPMTGDGTLKTPGFRKGMASIALPVMAYVFFELVIGLINMFAYFGGSSFTIASSAPMWGMLACAALMVSFVAITNRTPDPDTTMLVAFPLAIAVLLLLPFLGDHFGPQLSVLIYAAYIFTSTLTTFCYIRACWRCDADVYAMSSLVSLALRLMLLLGFALGHGCARLPNSEPLVRTGVMVAVCVYMLLFVIVVWHYKIARRPSEPQVVVRQVVQSFEEANDARLNALMACFGLTPRERDVYASLLRGGTAKSIAAELGISHYTVQGYVQSLYAKLGVNKKEQAVGLFYSFEGL